jgi:EmrB/QacA subfamily drug resistance transporter
MLVYSMYCMPIHQTLFGFTAGKTSQKGYAAPLNRVTEATQAKQSVHLKISGKTRVLVIGAAMLALFLGALDALVVGAAMPTIVADLGGLHLYGWVFSSYLLARAISLPIFGKLSDLYSSKKLYAFAITVFILSSYWGGAAPNMTQLIICRTLQGIGAGGTFALAYIVVADIAAPEKRGKMMGLISFVWGVASILGPALGGLIVSYFSWRWIFFMNLPLGFVALLAILLHLKEVREKKLHPSLDFLGALTLSIAVLALLTAFLLGGRSYPWLSWEIAGLCLAALCSGVAFCMAENKARDPILAMVFFRNREFSSANASAFFSSYAIFSLSAYSPLFIQGVLGKSPAELGMAMVPLSLGWSVGAFLCGLMINRERERLYGIFGSVVLILSSGFTVASSSETSLIAFSTVLAVAGVGMGYVSVATLLIVQNSLDAGNLGAATSSQQFARTLGGTIGIGISGSLGTSHLSEAMKSLLSSPDQLDIPSSFSKDLLSGFESILQPEIQASLSPIVQKALQQAVEKGVKMVFWSALAASLLSLICCYLVPRWARDR